MKRWDDLLGQALLVLLGRLQAHDRDAGDAGALDGHLDGKDPVAVVLARAGCAPWPLLTGRRGRGRRARACGNRGGRSRVDRGVLAPRIKGALPACIATMPGETHRAGRMTAGTRLIRCRPPVLPGVGSAYSRRRKGRRVKGRRVMSRRVTGSRPRSGRSPRGTPSRASVGHNDAVDEKLSGPDT